MFRYPAVKKSLNVSRQVLQSITRCQFQLSRRDRECLPFSLMLRDEIENFFPLVSCFETRSRISSIWSHASRRDREFLSSFSCFKTIPRRMLKKMHFCWGMASLIFSPDIKDTRGFQQDFMKIQVYHPISLTGIWFGFGSMRPFFILFIKQNNREMPNNLATVMHFFFSANYELSKTFHNCTRFTYGCIEALLIL